MLISVIFLAVLHTCTAHVVLTYPPARQYALDFLDNARTRPPCGVPRGNGPVTEFKAGTKVTVTWHIAFPHQGGFYLEVLDSNNRPVIRYEQSGQVVPEPEPEAESESEPKPEGSPEHKPEPKPETTAEPEHTAEPESTGEPEHEPEPTPNGGGNVGYIGYNDTTTLMYTITLPNMECKNCTLRLIRQALEWGVCSAPYLFWSCADINIVTEGNKNARAKCSNHGTWVDGHCFCDPMYEGNMCQFKDDCESAVHCGNHGVCVDTMATSYPKRQCYCDLGWFGRNCQYKSTVASRDINYGLYEQRQLGSDFNLYYRELKVEEEIEVVMRVRTDTWVGLGWKPTDFRSGCQLFPLLPGVKLDPHAEPETHGEPETTAEPETHGEPEHTSEPETHGEPETTSEPETHGEPETTSEPETHGEPESTSEPETHGEPETTGEPNSEPGSNVGLPPCNGRPAPISFGEPSPEGEPNSEPEPKSESEPKPTGEPETTPEPKYKAKPTAKPNAEHEPNSEHEPNAENEPNAESEPSPEGEPSGGGGTGYPTATVRGNKQGGRTHPMDCTDMVIGSARGQRSRIGDYYTRDRSTPQYDDFYGGMNSLTAALGFEEGDDTVILFRKKLKAKERTDYDIDAAPMTVIWAQGQNQGKYTHQFRSGLDVGRASDEMFYRQDELKYHGHRPNRGTATINFRERSAPPSGCTGKWPPVCNSCPYEAMWVQDLANDMVNFTIRARLGGEKKWIGLGFSSNQAMPDSDAVIGWVDGINVHISDRYISGYSPPAIDVTQNLVGTSGSVVNDVTEIKFSRKRSTEDSKDFEFTDTNCPYLLFAEGGSYDASNGITKHATTPQISAQKVCFTTKCATRGKTITTYVSMRFPKLRYVSAYGNKMSQEYKDLTSHLEKWVYGGRGEEIALETGPNGTRFQCDLRATTVVSQVYGGRGEEIALETGPNGTRFQCDLRATTVVSQIRSKQPDSLKSITVVNLKKGSVIADFRVISDRPDDSAASKLAHEAEVRDFFNSIKDTGKLGDHEVDPAYSLNQRDMEVPHTTGVSTEVDSTDTSSSQLTVIPGSTAGITTHPEVTHPGDKETHHMGLTLVEKIVIGVSVALCVIGLIVCVCKIREMRAMRSSSSIEKLANGSHGSNDSSSRYVNEKYSDRSSMRSNSSRMTYDQFLHTVAMEKSSHSNQGYRPEAYGHKLYNVYVP